MKNNLVLFIILILTITSCTTKEVEIVNEASSIIEFLPVKESYLDDNFELIYKYKYKYPDSLAFKATPHFNSIADKIDGIMGILATTSINDLPKTSEYSDEILIGLSDLKIWETPKFRVIAEKFRSIEYDSYIELEIVEK